MRAQIFIDEKSTVKLSKINSKDGVLYTLEVKTEEYGSSIDLYNIDIIKDKLIEELNKIEEE